MLERLNNDDWEEAFKYATPTPVVGAACSAVPFTREDVAEILAIEEGENDEQSWIVLLRLHDGRFAYLEAWCDLTGWDCQASGYSQVAHDLPTLIRFGVGQQSRRRFGMRLPEDPPADSTEQWRAAQGRL